jgi:hypothetical protein
VTDPQLYERAAAHFHQAGLVSDAARCYRLAGAYRRAADLHALLEEYAEAAADYERSGMSDLGAWLLAHRAGDPSGARAMIARSAQPRAFERHDGGAEVPLRLRLVHVRCEIGDGARPRTILPVVGDVCAELADPDALYDRFVEEWSVALGEHVRRYDQVALVYAASVRGGRYGAATRWAEWALRVLGTEPMIPTGAEQARQPA